MKKKLIDYFSGDELAASTWKNKYSLPGEETPDDMHHRMANKFWKVEEKFINEMDESKQAYISMLGREVINKLKKEGKDYIYNKFKNFGEIIPQGSVMSQLGANTIGSYSNCFVVASPEDSYGGILMTDQHLAQIMKRRGGVGVDISTLRPVGAETSNVAKTSTGAVSFMERFSNTTREVAQGGRRGALMISIDVNHPDVTEFIKIKQDLKKVTGANISVRVNDNFMYAVEDDKDYYLSFPVNPNVLDEVEVEYDIPYNTLIEYEQGKFIKRIKAKELWNDMMKAAHSTGEPGILNWDTVIDGPDGVYPEAKPISTNPCGEIPIPANDSCRLIAINLLTYVKNPYTNKAYFDFVAFEEACYLAQRLGDDLVELELEAVHRIMKKIGNDPEPDKTKAVELDLWREIFLVGEKYRRTGIGITGLGDTYAALGLPYGTKRITELIFESKFNSELNASVDMAIERGAFPGQDITKEYSTSISGDYIPKNNFYGMIMKNELLHQKMVTFGRRNISWSTIAPTGTVSMLAQTTSGIEPLFQPYYMRRRKINVNDTLTVPDFIDDNGDKWTTHPVLHHEFKNWICKKTTHPENLWDEKFLQEMYEDSPWFEQVANDIDYLKRVELQGIIQKYITHSISSTINLPNDVDVKTVDKIYQDAWRHKLKGVTVYRDGCRDGVLITQDKKTGKFEYSKAKVDRPTEVKSVAKVVKVGKESFSVIVGLIDDKPYELFAYKGGTKEGSGVVIKEGKGNYIFRLDEGVRDRIITGRMSPEQEVITRLISGSLRHGRDIKYIVKDLDKAKEHMFSFNAAISKVLKEYLSSENLRCENPECTGDGTNIIYEEGCHKCLDCGHSACS